MSTLTKTFVILNLIFSVAFVMVSATVLSQRQYWKDKHNVVKTKAEETQGDLEEQLRTLDGRNANLKAALDKAEALASSRGRQLTARDTAIREKDDAIAELKTNVKKAGERVDHLSQNVNRLASDLAAAQKSLNETKADLDKTKADLGTHLTTLVGLRAQLAGLNLKHKELLHRYSIASDRIEHHKKVEDFVARIAPGSLRRAREAASGSGDVEVPPIGQIRATVRAVDPKLGLVVLNVGSKSKPTAAKKGYRFLIHRGPSFVAAVQVISVDAEMCAARIVDPPTKAVIQVGDQAMTE